MVRWAVGAMNSCSGPFFKAVLAEAEIANVVPQIPSNLDVGMANAGWMHGCGTLRRLTPAETEPVEQESSRWQLLPMTPATS